MNIMFDMDGVLADFVAGFTLFGNQMYGTPITTTYDQPKWDGFPGLDKKQIDTIWDTIKRSTTFWADLGTMVDVGVFQRIDTLQSRHHLYFVTSRMGTYAHEQTVQWLEKQGIFRPEVLLVSSGRKGHAAAAIDADYSIDDKAGNCVYVGYHVPGIKSYIIDRLYNQFDGEVIGSKVIRIRKVSYYIDDIEAQERGL